MEGRFSMKILFILGAMAGLAGCGADAPPFVPAASANVSVGAGGLSTNTALGVSNGIISLGVSL